MGVSLFPLAMDWDGSIVAQTALCARLKTIVPLRTIGEDLRVWPEPGGMSDVLRAWSVYHEKDGGPWLTFLGSGDYHHMTLGLLEALPADQRPTTLVVVDNHPDWFLESPPRHCGNWVGTALATLHWLKQVILIGMDSDDLRGYRFWRAPWADLCGGRLQMYPYRKSKVTIPFRRCSPGTSPARARRTGWGVEWTFPTLLSQGVQTTFKSIAGALRGEQVYLSIDKDCLQRDELVTDWDQGGLRANELLSGVRMLSETVHLCGVDVCGDPADSPLRDWSKRLDTGRWSPRRRRLPTIQDYEAHERINLALLDALGVGMREFTS